MTNNDVQPHHHKQFTLKWQLKFIAMICFTGVLFLMKIVAGHITNSMALIADSFHMITDFAALTIGFIALRIANSKTSLTKNPSADKFTFGWVRAEVLGGLINTVFLLALCFSVLVSSLKRFIEPEHITKPVPLLIVGSVSLGVNLLGLLMFRTSRENFWSLCMSLLKKTNGLGTRRKDAKKDEVEGVSLITNKQQTNTGQSKTSFRENSIFPLFDYSYKCIVSFATTHFNVHKTSFQRFIEVERRLGAYEAGVLEAEVEVLS